MFTIFGLQIRILKTPYMLKVPIVQSYKQILNPIYVEGPISTELQNKSFVQWQQSQTTLARLPDMCVRQGGGDTPMLDASRQQAHAYKTMDGSRSRP